MAAIEKTIKKAALESELKKEEIMRCFHNLIIKTENKQYSYYKNIINDIALIQDLINYNGGKGKIIELLYKFRNILNPSIEATALINRSTIDLLIRSNKPVNETIVNNASLIFKNYLDDLIMQKRKRTINEMINNNEGNFPEKESILSEVLLPIFSKNRIKMVYGCFFL